MCSTKRRKSRISIHTTAKVVTILLELTIIQVQISIHTTAKVVTLTLRHAMMYQNDFNPHHREGGDRISGWSCLLGTNFNPHHREGGDGPQIKIYHPNHIFQSTPPRRW